MHRAKGETIMKTLYIDCGMGAAGDMLTAALLELLPEKDDFVKRLNDIGIPSVTFSAEKSVKCGITGTRVSVKVNGEEEDETMHGHSHENHHHEHDHEHDHEHHHCHSSLHDIEHIVSELVIPQGVKNDVIEVYKLIAEAESAVHGVPVTDIHFHEVGTMDAVADITAVCMLMSEISPDRVIASPIHVGSGSVRCAHGILPVPAPATACILKDIPIYSGSIEGELCTPTGAALLRHFVSDFGDMPVMKVGRIGYGMGRKDFEKANCVRAMLGEEDGKTDVIYELSCNLDDMTAEEIGFASEVLLENGAKDVFTVPIGMKKSRPGTLLCVICAADDRENIASLIFKHTTTIGLREVKMNRYVLERKSEIFHTSFGDFHRKDSKGYGVSRSKFEYDDISRIAKEKGISFASARKLLEETYK